MTAVLMLLSAMGGALIATVILCACVAAGRSEGVKRKSLEQQIEKIAENMKWELKNWESIRENGCYDPLWPDGVNMNLVRNHIIHDKKELYRLCGEAGIPLPAVYYEPIPSKVDGKYMAKNGQKFEE